MTRKKADTGTGLYDTNTSARPGALLRRAGYALCVLLVWVASGQWCEAQHEPPRFSSLTSSNGLSSNTVSTILRDRYGLLWFGTDDGLNRFNGSTFSVYRSNREDPSSLKSNDISALYEDPAGRVWVGTITGALHLYDRRRDSFVRVPTGHTVNAIVAGERGMLWVATTQGLQTVNPATLQVTSLPPGPGIPVQVAERHVHRLFLDHRKRLWVGTNEGLFRQEQPSGRFLPVRYLPEGITSPASGHISAIAADSLGHLWVGTYDGLCMLTSDGRLLRMFRYDHADDHSLSCNMVFAIGAESRDKLWVCTDGGLNILDISSGKVTRHCPDLRTPFSLTNKSIRSLLIDDSGICWLGTYKGGINKYDKNLTLFGMKRYAPYDPHGLTAPFVTSFAEKADGDLFIGTDGGGLNLFHRKTNLFSKYVLTPENKQASSGLAILTLALTSPNSLWVGTFQDGLFCLDPATGRYRQYTHTSDSTSLGNDDIFCLKQDRRGRLWVGTNGGGVNVFDPVTRKFTRYFSPSTLISRRIIPLNGYIRDILEDRHGRMWIASHGTGIAVFDPEKKTSIVLAKENSGLPGNNVLSLLEDRRGNIWAGTSGDGLAVWNPQTKRISSFGVRDGLASGVIHKVLEDAQGRIWVSTNEGISSIDPRTRKITNYASFNGLQNSTFVLGAGLRASDNTLFFGGISGFNYIDTRNLKRNRQTIPVVLSELKVGNRAVTFRDSAIIDADISVAHRISLDYKQSFSIGYAALNYTNPGQTRYRYRLSGLEQEWHEAGTGNTATYTNLGPGDYSFEVQAGDSESGWSPKGASIGVVVHPPFYLTPFAYLLYVTAPLALVFFMRRRGIRRLRRKFQLEQEKREQERIQELDRMKIKFLTNLSHEFRTPISLILAPAETLLSRPGEHTPQLAAIRRNAKRLLNLVDQLLDFRNLQNQELTLHRTPGDMAAAVKDAADSFYDLSKRRDIRFTCETSQPSLPMEFDSGKIERVLFNLLSNAFKFTPRGGRVDLRLTEGIGEKGETEVRIVVRDTGIGISPGAKERIFDRFFQDDTGSAVLNQGSGIGLSIVREFVELHGGRVSVESEPGQGTTFTVTLPALRSADLSPKIPAPLVVDIPVGVEEAVTKKSVEEPAGHRARVLVVEDNEEFRHLLKESLEPYYLVYEAADGEEGWKKTLSTHPDIVISDVAMPEMDGIRLSHKIKSDKRTSHIPVVLLTASTGEEQQLQGLQSGANDYLTKPFNFDILQAKVNNLLLLNRLLKNMYSRQIQFNETDAGIEAGDVKLLKGILAYIEENLTTSQLSVEKLARHVGMSRGTLYSKILEMSGQTPIEFIRSIKLEKAAMLLEKSDMNISQIAFAVGFTAPNYFAKSFKAQYHMLPSEYKSLKRSQSSSQRQEPVAP